MSYSVYKHTFPNGKVYIGITCRKPHRRWNNGNGYLNKINGKYTQPLMAKAILKYGWENVEHKILFGDLTKEDAEQKEIELIVYYKSNQVEFGYNISNGGNSTGKMSDSTKEKISKLHKGKTISEKQRRTISEKSRGRKHSQEWIESMKGEGNPFYGKHHTEETKRKLSNIHIGLKASDEAKKKMSEARKGRGLSDETKKKIGKANKGNKRPDLSERNKNGNMPIICVETKIIYYGQKEASRQTNISQSSIWKCLHGKQETAGGYHWEFVEQEIA